MLINYGISIILAIKNDQKHLEKFVQNFKSINLNNIELIIVDVSKFDISKNKNRYNYRNIKYFNINQNSSNPSIKNLRGLQINFGVRKSKFDIIFIPDADMAFRKPLLFEILIL